MDEETWLRNRQNFIEWSGKTIIASAKGGIVVVANWKTFLIMQLLHIMMPDERPALAKYAPLIIRVLLEFQITGNGGLGDLIYPLHLWACGYGSREKGALHSCYGWVPDWLGLRNIFLRILCIPLGAVIVSNLLGFFATLFYSFFVRKWKPPLVDYNLLYLLCYQLASIIDLEIYSNPRVLWEYYRFVTREEVKAGLEQGQIRQEGLENFKYSRVGPKEIRLLQLLPEPKIGRRRYRLVTKSLEDAANQYYAISYVWGNDKRTHGLPINDTWLQTTESTFEILNQRVPGWDRDLNAKWWWIDFVCINQDDKDERKEQVKIMDKIYLGAKGVVAFLKPCDPNESDIARHFLYSLESDLENRKRRTYGLPLLNMSSNKYMPVIAGMISSSTGVSPSPGWQAISNLIGHAYWSRMWIMQEVILSKRLAIYYGEHELDWLQLGLFVKLDGRQERHIDWDIANLVTSENFNESRHKILLTTQFKARYEDKIKLDIREILMVVPRMGAGDARDRLFALLGLLDPDLVKNKLPPELVPNYTTVTAEDVYLSLAKYIWQERDPEWVLCMAGIGYAKPKGFKPRCDSCARELTELPSWVPDWRIPHPIPFPHLRDFNARDSLPSAASNREKLSVRLQNNKPTLLTSKIGTVKSVIQITDIFVTITMTNAGDHTEKFLWAWRRLLRAMASFQDMYPTYVDTLGRTLTAGLGDGSCFRSLYQTMERRRSLFDSLHVRVHPLENHKSEIFGMFSDMKSVFDSNELKIWHKWTDVCKLRALAITDEKVFALVPEYTMVGDEIRAFDRMESCFVTRVKEDDVLFLVGDCYVDGFDVRKHINWVTKTIS